MGAVKLGMGDGYSAVDSSGRYGNFSAVGGSLLYLSVKFTRCTVLRVHKMASLTQIEMLIELKFFDII